MGFISLMTFKSKVLLKLVAVRLALTEVVRFALTEVVRLFWIVLTHSSRLRNEY